MKEIPNMTHLFDKLDDLKKVFEYGQKIIPVLASLIDFMRDTVPLLENVNSSIADSTRQIPKAKHHINDVTKSTELATTEILDIVDVVSGDLSGIEGNLKKMLNEKSSGLDSDVQSELDSTISSLGKIKNNVFNITLSLQVQDITSQQLAAVNHLIEAVQEKLSSLIEDIENNDLRTELSPLEIDAPQDSTFNPQARYEDATGKQELVDDLMDKMNSRASQDEIDKLFS